MIHSDLKLDVLEVFLVTSVGIFVVDWVVTLVATSGVEPTVGVSFWVVSEFEHNTHLGHNFISVASVTLINVKTITATGVTFLSILFPKSKINTVGWVIWLPLRSSLFRSFALWKISNLKILIILTSIIYIDPRKTQAHTDGITKWHMILIEREQWECT